MKTIILAGGFGTRLSEYTEAIPKPMVSIGGKPIIWHVMSTYARFGIGDFCVALGYKSTAIKEYFLNYKESNSDFTINLGSGKIRCHNHDTVNWNVTLVDTGLDTMTGGRLKRMQEFVGDQTCMLTYGDGVANVDIDALLNFHKSHGKMITVTAVHPAARFGELQLEGESVRSFKEKPQISNGWINGGYFVIEPEFFSFIDGDDTILERYPLEKAAAAGELMAYKHHGFWMCMDTKRDRDILNELCESNDPPWLSD